MRQKKASAEAPSIAGGELALDAGATGDKLIECRSLSSFVLRVGPGERYTEPNPNPKPKPMQGQSPGSAVCFGAVFGK